MEELKEKQLSDCKGTGTHNQLIYKRKLNHLTKVERFFTN